MHVCSVSGLEVDAVAGVVKAVAGVLEVVVEVVVWKNSVLEAAIVAVAVEVLAAGEWQ